ncbi:MAG: DUF6511 domain-containing protein [Rickettsiales bacterium]|nr:DUF6511 domain-containing protein [Rickettsiales bacterium]
MINKTKNEQLAVEAALKPVAEYVGEIGFNVPVGNYSKQQILGLIEVVVTAFQDSLIKASSDFIDDDIPF